jgi:hypothetical protein
MKIDAHWTKHGDHIVLIMTPDCARMVTDLAGSIEHLHSSNLQLFTDRIWDGYVRNIEPIPFTNHIFGGDLKVTAYGADMLGDYDYAAAEAWKE